MGLIDVIEETQLNSTQLLSQDG